MELETPQGKKEYTTVHERLLLLKQDKVDYSIKSEYAYLEEQRRFIVRSTLTIYKQGQAREYTGLDSEVVGEGGEVNDTAALENAETSAVGRALGFAGYGIAGGIPTKNEMDVKTSNDETILKNLDDHLKTLKTSDDVDKAADQFSKKYALLWKQTAVQKKFKKRKGEIVIENVQPAKNKQK